MQKSMQAMMRNQKDAKIKILTTDLIHHMYHKPGIQIRLKIKPAILHTHF